MTVGYGSHGGCSAWFEHHSRGILGVHAIGLNDGGRRKGYSKHGQPKGPSTVYHRHNGQFYGGGVWLGTPGGELVVGEGLETTLSAMVILERGWGVATLGTKGMRLLDLPNAAECVVIAADNDDGRNACRSGRGSRSEGPLAGRRTDCPCGHAQCPGYRF
jgi:hypothetical protein